MNDGLPRHLRPLHRARWIERLWSVIDRHARTPVVVEPMRGQVLVELLGLFRYFRRPDGSFDVWARRLRARRTEWDAVEDGNAPVTPVPFRDVWVRGIAELVDARFPGPESPLRDEYVEWVAAHLATRVRRGYHLETIRTHIAAQLGVRDDVARLARRIPRTCKSGDDAAALRVDVYNRVARSFDAYAKLARENPNLLPLYGVLSALPGFPTAGEPAERLRDYLWVRGVSDAGWRIVANAPPRLWLRHLPFYREPVGDAVVDILRLIDLLRAVDAPPAWFLRELFALRGHGLQDVVLRYAPQMRTLQHLARLVERADEPTLVRVRDELHGVLTWVADGAGSLPPRTLRRDGWATFARRAAKWKDIQREQRLRRNLTWPVPFARIALGPYEAVAIGNAFELWQEGEAMHHCAARFDVDCAAGEHVIVSLRARGRERPVCTACYRRGSEGWELAAVAGFANATPPEPLQRLLAGLCEQLDRWRGRAGDAPDIPCLTLWLQHLADEEEARVQSRTC